MGALYKGLIATGVLSVGAIAIVNFLIFGGFGTRVHDRRRRDLHLARRCSGARSSASP